MDDVLDRFNIDVGDIYSKGEMRVKVIGFDFSSGAENPLIQYYRVGSNFDVKRQPINVFKASFKRVKDESHNDRKLQFK